MAFWLFKQEPDCYNYAALEAEGETLWDGVANPAALKNLRATRPGDFAFFYHTGDEKSVVGVMEITGEARPDPKQSDEKLVVVPVKPVRRLANPVTLAAVKADPSFADWELVRIPRLSVMPVTAERWKRIEEMAKGTTAVATPRNVGKRK